MRSPAMLTRVARYALPVAGAALTGAVGAATYTAYLLNQPRRWTWRDEFSFSPFEVDVPYEDVAFTTEDGLTLRGWLFPRHQTRRVAICLHGHRGAKSDLLGIGSGLWRSGYNVLLFDFRGCGTSDPARLSLAHHEVRDARSAVEFIVQRIPCAEIALVGFSMGAAVAILTAAGDERVRAVVADSSFTGIREVVAFNQARHRLPSSVVSLTDVVNRWRYGYPFAAVRPIDVVGMIAPCPILIVHGSEDALIPLEHAEQLYERAGDPKELWIVDGVQHCGAYFADRPVYVRRVADFLDDALDAPKRLETGTMGALTL